MKVFGIKLFVYNSLLKKSLIIFGYIDDVIIDFLNDKYITNKINKFKESIPNEIEINTDSFDKFLSSLSLKDYLVYDNNDIYSKYAGYACQINILRQKPISHTVKEFINDDMFNKRNTIIILLIISSPSFPP
jgi:hypothetical protein